MFDVVVIHLCFSLVPNGVLQPYAAAGVHSMAGQNKSSLHSRGWKEGTAAAQQHRDDERSDTLSHQGPLIFPVICSPLV
jgi:hypothetical protein